MKLNDKRRHRRAPTHRDQAAPERMGHVRRPQADLYVAQSDRPRRRQLGD